MSMTIDNFHKNYVLYQPFPVRSNKNYRSRIFKRTTLGLRAKLGFLLTTTVHVENYITC